MDRLLSNLMMVVRNDLIKPLTAELNDDLSLKLTEDYIVTLLGKADVKQAPKSNRTTKNSNNTLYQVRPFPGTLELVKLPNHNRLYLHGKSLVVYLRALLVEVDRCEEDAAPPHEEDCETIAKGISNPERELGYRFHCTAIAVGSIHNKSIVSLTDSDHQLCLNLNIPTKVADKIRGMPRTILFNIPAIQIQKHVVRNGSMSTILRQMRVKATQRGSA